MRVRSDVRLKSRAGALRGIDKTVDRDAASIQARRIQGGVDDTELVVLIQESLLIFDARFDVVNALGVGDVGESSGIEQRPLLADGFPLQIRRAQDRRTDRCWDSS